MLRQTIDADVTAMLLSAGAYLDAVNASLGEAWARGIDAGALNRSYATAVAAATRAWATADAALSGLLRRRIDGLADRLRGSLLLIGTLGVFSILLAVLTHRHIVGPLKRLEDLAGTVRESKNYSLRSSYHSRDEIGRLAAAFNDMLAELARARARELADQARTAATQAELARVARLTTMGEMTASIAHEVNQPLAAIAANANAGLRWLTNTPPGTDEAQAALKRIVNDSHRASEVIGSVRAMFRKDDHARAPLDINELLREILALMQGQLESQQVLLQTELGDRLPQVVAHRIQLQQVILNLVMNAVEAMSSLTDRRRVLRVCSQAHNPPGVVLTVEDCGTGIDPQHVERIFDAFFTTKHNGTGLGLSICRSIIEAHGGRLSVSPAPRHGSIFQVLLPAGPASAA